MTKGLLVSIYRNAEGYDCSNNGVSARFTKAVLTGPGIPEIFSPSETAPELRLTPRTRSNPHQDAGFCAVPVEKGQGCGPMAGGSFVYTSDSRFPSRQPIPIHDRWETPIEYARNSK